MSRQFATNITTIYDIFCPVPFLPSPFGFRQLKIRKLGGSTKWEEKMDFLDTPKRPGALWEPLTSSIGHFFRYHPCQNHYTHEILFRGLHWVFRINSHYSDSFLRFSSRIQLQERIPKFFFLAEFSYRKEFSRNSQEFPPITVT